MDDEITAWALAGGAGDHVAAAAFVRATQGEITRFLAHLVSPREAADLTQETYLRAFRSLPRFAGRSSARTWLFSIARRVVVDQIRATSSRPRTAAVQDWVVTAELAQPLDRDRIDEQVALRALLDTLPIDQREAFVATQIIGLSYEDAAQVAGCPIGTIRSRVARARDHLVTQMRGGAGEAAQSRRTGA